jgi:hypothetical protein
MEDRRTVATFRDDFVFASRLIPSMWSEIEPTSSSQRIFAGSAPPRKLSILKKQQLVVQAIDASEQWEVLVFDRGEHKTQCEIDIREYVPFREGGRRGPRPTILMKRFG